MEERDAFKPRTQPKSRAKEIPGARMETDGQGVNRQAETERERGQGHPGFCQGHRDTGLQRMENQESQEGTEPGPRSSREEEGGGRGRPGGMVPKGEGCRREAPDPSLPQRPAAASRDSGTRGVRTAGSRRCPGFHASFSDTAGPSCTRRSRANLHFGVLPGAPW